MFASGATFGVCKICITYVHPYSDVTLALTPYLESTSFNLDGFFSVLHSVGSTATLLLYMLMADR